MFNNLKLRLRSKFLQSKKNAAYSGIGKKLRSKAGLSLVELIAAMAVVAIMGAALAASLPVTISVYKEITLSSESEMLASTLQTAISDELRYASNISEVGENVRWTSKRSGNSTTMVNVSGCVKLRSIADDGSLRITDFISEKAYTNGLSVETKVSYDGELFKVAMTVYTGADDSLHEWKKYDFYVRPLNE